MSTRFSLGLLAVVGLAIIIGVVAGRSQPPTAAALAPTSTPTAIPTPPPGQVSIVTDSSSSSGALFLAPNGTSVYAVRVGQKVTWLNTDTQTHSVTADGGAFSSPPLATGQKFSWQVWLVTI